MLTAMQPRPPIINVYIDGYNFYYSISKKARVRPELLELGWCNFRLLGKELVSTAFPTGALGAVKYFTAEVPPGELELSLGESERQALWLEALRLGTQKRVHIIEGYQTKHRNKRRQEKQTDTNLAISMLRDALISPTDPRRAIFTGNDPCSPCDGMILISGDNDFRPAVSMVSHYNSRVAIFQALASHREGSTNRDHPSVRRFDIGERVLRDCRLPNRIQREDQKSAITWAQYMRLKALSTSRSPERDSKFLAECANEGANSPDRSTKVGCIVIDKKGFICARGHNTLPLGIHPVPANRLEGADKYYWIEHAERNTIYQAGRHGVSLKGCTMYVDLAPCADCARAIVQSEFAEVVVSRERMLTYDNAAYEKHHEVAAAMLKEAGVILRRA